MQRPSQESHIAADRLPTGQPADCLVNNRLEYRGGKVFFRCALVDKGLDIRFCKYTAARGDRVD